MAKDKQKGNGPCSLKKGSHKVVKNVSGNASLNGRKTKSSKGGGY